jgi:hypothetical protein
MLFIAHQLPKGLRVDEVVMLGVRRGMKRSTWGWCDERAMPTTLGGNHGK